MQISPEIKKIIRDIKSLKIQGARNVARAVMEAIILHIKKTRVRSLDGLYSEILVLGDYLASTRPTEPMLRNSVKDIINFTYMNLRTEKNIKSLKSKLIAHEDNYLKNMKSNSEMLASYGSRIIEDGSVIMTYCHSSTVASILKKAHNLGKEFEVIACETRPKFQGRITARELVNAGINTTLIVDGAMNTFMRKVDLVLVGADAITSTGDLVNKVGTGTLSHIAKFHDVPFYSAAEVYKYDPLTLYGTREKIEERSTKEVWEKPPKKLKIRNPAFDLIESRYISAYITDEGVISSNSFRNMFNIKSKKAK